MSQKPGRISKLFLLFFAEFSAKKAVFNPIMFYIFTIHNAIVGATAD